MLLVFFVCNSVMIGQNVLNEVSGESSMVADFAYYHLNNLSGKLNWSRRNRYAKVHIMDQND